MLFQHPMEVADLAVEDPTVRLNDRMSVKCRRNGFRPFRCRKHDIAIDPNHFVTSVGQVTQSRVEQVFFLPHDIALCQANQDIGIILPKLGSVEFQCHGQ